MSDNTSGTPAPEPDQPSGAPTPPPYSGAPTPPPYGQAPGAAAPPAYGAPVYGQPAYGQPAAFGAPAYPAGPKTNTLAIVSLIFSIAAFVIVPFIGSIVGVITGHMALGQIKNSGEEGRGLALAGTIVGWVGLGLTIIGTVLFVLLIIPFMMSVNSVYS